MLNSLSFSLSVSSHILLQATRRSQVTPLTHSLDTSLAKSSTLGSFPFRVTAGDNVAKLSPAMLYVPPFLHIPIRMFSFSFIPRLQSPQRSSHPANSIVKAL